MIKKHKPEELKNNNLFIAIPIIKNVCKFGRFRSTGFSSLVLRTRRKPRCWLLGFFVSIVFSIFRFTQDCNINFPKHGTTAMVGFAFCMRPFDVSIF